jgi:hypothetical protein
MGTQQQPQHLLSSSCPQALATCSRLAHVLASAERGCKQGTPNVRRHVLIFWYLESRCHDCDAAAPVRLQVCSVW